MPGHIDDHSLRVTTRRFIYRAATMLRMGAYAIGYGKLGTIGAGLGIIAGTAMHIGRYMGIVDIQVKKSAELSMLK